MLEAWGKSMHGESNLRKATVKRFARPPRVKKLNDEGNYYAGKLFCREFIRKGRFV